MFLLEEDVSKKITDKLECETGPLVHCEATKTASFQWPLQVGEKYGAHGTRECLEGI
jgi:hypothetical protein